MRARCKSGEVRVDAPRTHREPGGGSRGSLAAKVFAEPELCPSALPSISLPSRAHGDKGTRKEQTRCVTAKLVCVSLCVSVRLCVSLCLCASAVATAVRWRHIAGPEDALYTLPSEPQPDRKRI